MIVTVGIKKGDIIVISALLAFALLLPLLSLANERGMSVTVFFDGKSTVIPLSKDAEVHFKNEKGELTLAVKDGYAFVKDSTCPDLVCEKSGRIQKKNESILCAHIGFLAKISDRDTEACEDAIAG